MIQFLRKLIQKGSAESSKRFMALATMILIYYVVLRFGNSENLETILAELLTFITALSGVSTYESIQKTKNM